MFRIKVCGVTRVGDAIMAAECGVDAIGLNFYPPSPRCVSMEQARRIVEALPAGIATVGVFVNAPVREMVDAFDRLQLRFVQLHGDETADLIAQLEKRPVLKAFRCKKCSSDEVIGYLGDCRDRDVPLAGVLLDAYSPDQYGGTGVALDWDAVARVKGHLGDLPLVLAGGLTEDNVERAIRAAGPSAVDTASGVESAPGVKERDRTRRFAARASAAFARRV